jgi:hypothetical protein
MNAGSAQAGGLGGIIEKGSQGVSERVRSDIGQALYTAQWVKLILRRNL